MQVKDRETPEARPAALMLDAKAEKANGSATGNGKGIRAVDLFCGAGGLTHGLASAGIETAFGVDVDPACEYPYRANNRAEFLLEDLRDMPPAMVTRAFAGAEFTLLAGCPPCQPFSTYCQRQPPPRDERWDLLEEFGRLVRETGPDLVTMENVPRLQEVDVFKKFVRLLRDGGYRVDCQVVKCAEYGVPQERRRLVLLASRIGDLKLVDPTRSPQSQLTVRDAIQSLPRIRAGETCGTDPLHQSCRLSDRNLQRIRSSKPGGTWRDWDSSLMAACHKRRSGRSYPSVYGRMEWDKPAPTVTTQYFGFGNGRFGHPEQDRAISLREGAILQTFPRSYRFVPEGEPVCRKRIGRLIGNAVPVKLAEAIGKSVVQHVHAARPGGSAQPPR